MGENIVVPSTKPSGQFRKWLPDLKHPRFTTMQNQNAHEYVDAFKKDQNPPWLYNLYVHWRELFQEPYKGITNDGELHPQYSLSILMTYRRRKTGSIQTTGRRSTNREDCHSYQGFLDHDQCLRS